MMQLLSLTKINKEKLPEKFWKNKKVLYICNRLREQKFTTKSQLVP